jgi:hypothetical protein
VLFSLYVNDIPTPSRHVELAQYADDTVLVSTPRSPSLFVGYLEAHLGRLERCLLDLRIAIVSRSTAVLFVKTERSIQRPRRPDQCSFSKSQFSGSKQGGTAYLVGRRQPGGKKCSSKIGRAWSHLLNRRSDLTVKSGVLLYTQLIRPMMDYACPI